MDRYSYYLVACKAENRLPLGPDYFQLQFVACVHTMYPDLIDYGQDINCFDEVSDGDRDIIDYLVRTAASTPPEPNLADKLASAWGRLFNQQQSTANERPPEDGPPLEGGAGAREPRRPVAPLVSGSAGREYPPTESAHWWAM